MVCRWTKDAMEITHSIKVKNMMMELMIMMAIMTIKKTMTKMAIRSCINE